ncbi:MAG: hypothetical protein AB7H80_13655 [Candidatus Kapaibacterium sp.]
MNDQYEENAQTQTSDEPVDLEFVEGNALEQLKREQNLPRGVLFGVGAALVGAGLWAAITISTGYQIGFMAIGVGLLVGFAVRKGGQGIEQIFGIVGASLAFLGCLLGNVFTALNFGWPLNSELFSWMFSDFMDFLFYGLAIYEGYKFSFRRVTESDLAHAAS